MSVRKQLEYDGSGLPNLCSALVSKKFSGLKRTFETYQSQFCEARRSFRSVCDGSWFLSRFGRCSIPAFDHHVRSLHHRRSGTAAHFGGQAVPSQDPLRPWCADATIGRLRALGVRATGSLCGSGTEGIAGREPLDDTQGPSAKIICSEEARSTSRCPTVDSRRRASAVP